jgi:tetratricopeptide (TPR) repeat protein
VARRAPRGNIHDSKVNLTLRKAREYVENDPGMLRNLLICAMLVAAAQSLSAQQIDPSKPPPPPPPEAPAVKPIDPSTPPPPPPADEPEAAAPSEPVFDPLHANRSMDVGTFYLRAGKVDAAIDRFIEAAHYEPALAKPWKLLGEAYEKKEAYSSSIQAYKKYLDLLPDAKDANKVLKRIADLEEKVEKESTKTAAH